MKHPIDLDTGDRIVIWRGIYRGLIGKVEDVAHGAVKVRVGTDMRWIHRNDLWRWSFIGEVIVKIMWFWRMHRPRARR